jgi:hypothetical protein
MEPLLVSNQAILVSMQQQTNAILESIKHPTPAPAPSPFASIDWTPLVQAGLTMLGQYLGAPLSPVAPTQPTPQPPAPAESLSPREVTALFNKSQSIPAAPVSTTSPPAVEARLSKVESLT